MFGGAIIKLNCFFIVYSCIIYNMNVNMKVNMNVNKNIMLCMLCLNLFGGGVMAFRPPLPFVDGLVKFRPLSWIISSRGVVSSIVRNVNTEVLSYDNIMTQTDQLISQVDWTFSSDNHVYVSMVGLFIYYLWIYSNMNSFVVDKRLDNFSTFGISKRITNQICFVFIFVFTKDVLYVF